MGEGKGDRKTSSRGLSEDQLFGGKNEEREKRGKKIHYLV